MEGKPSFNANFQKLIAMRPQPTSLSRRAASIASALALWARPSGNWQMIAASAATPVEEIRKAASVLPGYGPPDLLYPAPFLGRWQVSRQLGDFKTPLGEAAVPEDALRRLLAEPKLATYEVRHSRTFGSSAAATKFEPRATCVGAELNPAGIAADSCPFWEPDRLTRWCCWPPSELRAPTPPAGALHCHHRYRRCDCRSCLQHGAQGDSAHWARQPERQVGAVESEHPDAPRWPRGERGRDKGAL